MKKFKLSFLGGLCGALAGCILRPLAVLLWILIHRVNFEETLSVEMLSLEMLSGFLPSAAVGFVVGAIAGMFPRKWYGVFYGGLLSGVAFAAWSLGPFTMWLIHIKFQVDMLALFIVSGALAGLVGSCISERKCSKNSRANYVPSCLQYSFSTGALIHFSVSLFLLFRVSSMVGRRISRGFSLTGMETTLASLRDGLLFPVNALMATDQDVLIGNPGAIPFLLNSLLWGGFICLITYVSTKIYERHKLQNQSSEPTRIRPADEGKVE